MKTFRRILSYTMALVIIILSSCGEESPFEEYKDWRAENEAFMKKLEEQYNREGGAGKLKRIKSDNYPRHHVYYQVIEESGTDYSNPKYTDFVRVFYKGTDVRNRFFDGNFKGKNPIVGNSDVNSGDTHSNVFQSNSLIIGWREALGRMKKGDRWIIYIPWQLGYGTQKSNNIDPFSTLIFDITLIDFNSKKEKL